MNAAARPEGRLLEFQSPVDGRRHPIAVCATPDVGRDSGPLPLILEVSPGAISDLPAAIAVTEKVADFAARNGRSCVVARPTGRGPGSVYQNYGEVDVLEAIEFVASHWPIDRDRIGVTASSMGGAATLYLASHYPDLFAGAVSFCGYADYRLWQKPGGLTFPLRPWEEASWRSRSAAFLGENLTRTPVWLLHGEWDRSVGGGVSVEHSRQISRLLDRVGARHRYTEVPRTGHDVRSDRLWEETVIWLLGRRKVRLPDRVSFVTYELRHNRSAWVAVEQQERSGQRSFVEARLVGGTRLIITTTNIRTLSLGPIPTAAGVVVVIDDQESGSVDLRRPTTIRRDGSTRWGPGRLDLTT